jgi:glycosyltransferase involved in cell wall biosynthesis
VRRGEKLREASGTPPLSILFLAGEYPPRPGGVGDYTALLAAHLAVQGARVTVLASKALPTQHSGLRRAQQAAPLPDLTQHSARSTQHSVTVWRAVEGWDWRCARVVLAAVRAARPDVVHVQYQPAAFGMAAAVHWLPEWLRRRCPAVRTLTTFHDLRVPYLFPKAGAFRGAVRDRLLHGSDAVLFTERTDWAAAAHARPVGRYWVPIGSNLAPTPPANFERAAWRRAVGADADMLLIAHLGILNRSKGLETLFAALPRLQAAGRRARLLLVGAEAGASDASNRAYAAEVERRLTDPALGALVHRLPLVPPEVASGYFLAADVAAFPFADGASLRRGSLLAALAHGVPTVSTAETAEERQSRGRRSHGQGTAVPSAGLAPIRVPGTPPALDEPELRDGENLLLVPPGDAAALAAVLERLADDATLRARLAAGGRALTDALSWPRIAAAHRAVYAETLRRPDRFAGSGSPPLR